MHLSAFFLRTFNFHLSIRRHQNSPKFGSVQKTEMLPHNTDTLNQRSECLRCIKIIVIFNFDFREYSLFPTHTVALCDEQRDGDVVKCLPSLRPLNNCYLKLFVVRTSISSKAQRSREAGCRKRVDGVLTFRHRASSI